MNYKTYDHAKTKLTYHLIFSTKYRRKCLNAIHDSVIEAFRYVESKSKFSIKTMELDKDHIHLMVEFGPSLSISSIVNRLKSMTTKYLYDDCGDYLKKFYWNKDILWTHGYFCSSIGEVSEETLRRYIENQG